MGIADGRRGDHLGGLPGPRQRQAGSESRVRLGCITVGSLVLCQESDAMGSFSFAHILSDEEDTAT